MIKKRIGSNMIEICSDDNKFIILISYSTPVAAYDAETDMFYISLVRYSVTTQKHIKKWLDSKHFKSDRIIKVDPLFFSEFMKDKNLN
jgi:hypothetical protein